MVGTLGRGRRGERGQVALMTALLMTAIAGVLSLVVDLGYAYGQRRLAQNVADSGAVAAAKVVAANMMVPGSTSDSLVAAAIADIAANSSGGWTGKYTASYVAADGTSVGTVGQIAGNTIPATARGVHVIPAKPVPSFFGSMLGFTSLAVGTQATARSDYVTSFDSQSPQFGQYAVWGGNASNLCADGVSYGCNLLGTTVTYLDNAWKDVTGASSSGRWTSNSNNFKGFIRANSQIVGTGDWVSSGGNACGQQPLGQMQAAQQNGTPVVMPVVDQGSGNGHVDLHVIGFVGVKLLTAGCPGPQTGVVVSLTVNYGGLVGGSPPPAGMPAVTFAHLTQ